MLSPNVSVVSTTGTTEGDTVTLQCEDGLFPVMPAMSIHVTVHGGMYVET